MEEREYEQETLNPFIGRFDDGLSLTVEALRGDQKSYGPVGRAALASVMFSVEAFANCCLDALGYHRKLTDAVERLRTMEKIDLYLAESGLSDPKTVRDAEQFEQVQSLLNARNRLVHPRYESLLRPKGSIWVPTSGKFPLPEQTRSWSVGYAVEALRLVDGFVGEILAGLDDSGRWEMLSHFNSERKQRDAPPELKNRRLGYLQPEQLELAKEIELKLLWHPLWRDQLTGKSEEEDP